MKLCNCISFKHPDYWEYHKATALHMNTKWVKVHRKVLGYSAWDRNSMQLSFVGIE